MYKREHVALYLFKTHSKAIKIYLFNKLIKMFSRHSFCYCFNLQDKVTRFTSDLLFWSLADRKLSVIGWFSGSLSVPRINIMNETEGLRFRRVHRPQVITDELPEHRRKGTGWGEPGGLGRPGRVRRVRVPQRNSEILREITREECKLNK